MNLCSSTWKPEKYIQNKYISKQPIVKAFKMTITSTEYVLSYKYEWSFIYTYLDMIAECSSNIAEH